MTEFYDDEVSTGRGDEAAVPARSGCGDHCCRRGSRDGRSDLAALVEAPGFSGSVLGGHPLTVGAAMPLLDEVVAVTAAGPVILNDIGVHHSPSTLGGLLPAGQEKVGLRLHPDLIGAAIACDPAGGTPPSLRLFDDADAAVHTSYLTHTSDRLAFEALGMLGAAPDGTSGPDFPPFRPASEVQPPEDQIDLFDTVLDDGGLSRVSSLFAGRCADATEVPAPALPEVLEKAAQRALPLSLCATGSGSASSCTPVASTPPGRTAGTCSWSPAGPG